MLRWFIRILVSWIFFFFFFICGERERERKRGGEGEGGEREEMRQCVLSRNDTDFC